MLLTNKSLSFSAHAINNGRTETKINLNEITEVKVISNLLISQKIFVLAGGESNKFVVNHGKEWVKKIKEAIEKYEELAAEMD